MSESDQRSDVSTMMLDKEARAIAKRLLFPPFTISPETAQTAILMLSSKERDVICQTLRAITKFCAEAIENCKIIYKSGALETIMEHVDSFEVTIQRFALKVISQLCQIPEALQEVLQNRKNLKKMAAHLVRSDDLFVLEFASLVLAELTQEPVGCEQLATENILGTLFHRMKSCVDPDVQKNCIQILCNLLADPVCSPDVTKNQNFSWPSLLTLIHSPFLAIQHISLRTVDQLICRYNDEILQKTFRHSDGIRHLCDILECYDFRDVHAQVLGVIKNYVNLEENSDYLHQSGCMLRLQSYLGMALPVLKPHCLAVFTKMSYHRAGRNSLFETGTDLIFCHQLMTSNVDLLADAAMGIANMTQLLPSAIRMCDTNVIEALCAILNDDTASWYCTRVNALLALSALCATIPKAAYNLVEPKTFWALRNINKKYKETPIEAQRIAAQCFINLLHFHVSAKAMLNGEFMSEILNVLERIDTCLKIMGCEVLTGMMTADPAKAKELFGLKKGEDVVSKYLEIEHVGLRTALCNLIIASITDAGAERYLELGTIQFMVEKKLARYMVSSWDAALEAIFAHHPSAKFAYKGRLEVNDYTVDGFYVMKRLESPVPTLRALLAAPVSYCYPVFVCAMQPGAHRDRRQSETGTEDDEDTETTPRRRRASSVQSVSQMRALTDDPQLKEYLLKMKLRFGDPQIQEYYMHKADWSISSSFDEEFQMLESDTTLASETDPDTEMLYMRTDTNEIVSYPMTLNTDHKVSSKSMLYIEMEDAHYDVRYREKCDEVSSTVKEQAQLLAEFVQEQMSGLSQETECSMPCVDLHLTELMLEFNSRVIGLGYVRSGGPLERAVLYKVLADRLGIPCALVRNAGGHASCQVAVPETDSDVDLKTQNHFPAKYLRPNYVVDLMSPTPKLCPMKGYEASKVYGNWAAKPYTAKSPSVVCQCSYNDKLDTV